MSDRQKVIYSLVGAVFGHLLFFLLLGLLFAVSALVVPQRSEAARAIPPAPAPREVTVMLADLLKQVEVAPKELSQQYMRTDPDQESAVKPENAPFHSDRNTVATSVLPPDRASDLAVPTVQGRTDLPFVEIRDREFLDGEFLDKSAASAPSTAATAAAMATPSVAQPTLTLNDASDSRPTPPRDPSEQRSEETLENPADPADRPREAPQAKPKTPAQADTPPETVAEKDTQPAATTGATAREALRENSLKTLFAADPVAVAKSDPERDREAEALRKTEDNGAPAAPETPMAASALPMARPFLPAPPLPPNQNPAPAQNAAVGAANSADLPPSPKPPSDAPAFTPETRTRSMQGNVGNLGNTPSFDVEASALGKYKKLVTQAVERQWHRYREQHAEFVTYGNLKVKFRVDKDGTPRGLKIVKKDANAVMADFTLRAVLDADIPAMPADIASLLGASGLEITYDVIVY